MNQLNIAFQKKLRNYSVLAGSILAAAGAANAQVIYHPLNIVLTGGGWCAIDLNADGTPDFDISQDSGGTKADAKLDFGSSVNSNFTHDRFAAVAGSIMRTSASNSFIFGLPYAYSSEKKIDLNAKWFSYGNILSSAGGAYRAPVLASNAFRGAKGNWSQASNKYLALKLTSGGQIHYGWLRLSVGLHGDSVKIFGYAYQSTPDSSILTGEGYVTGISSHGLSNISVYSSGKIVFVKYPGISSGYMILVNDINGNEIKVIRTSDELCELNLDNCAAGIYTIRVKIGQSEITKKVSIQ